VDVELAVDARQVELDRLRAEEERRGDVAVRSALSDLKRDLKLLRGELLGCRGIAPGDRLPARSELAACLLRPGRRAEPVEELNRAAQMLSRVDAVLRASEPLAVEELRPRACIRLAEALSAGKTNAWIGSGLRGCSQVGEHRKNAAVVVGRLLQLELPEDLSHVRLDRLWAQEQRLADRSVRTPLGHERQHLAFALCQLVERAAFSRAVDEP
jgi:hypothetical protein